MRLRVAVAATLLVAVASACSNGDDDAEPASEATSTTAAGAEATVAKVELISAGAAPRAVIRLRPAAGAEQRLTLSQRVAQRISVGGESQSADTPATEFDIRNRVVSVADGRFETEQLYEAARVVDQPGVDPQVAAQMRSALGGVVGAKGRAVYNERGAIVEFDAPELELEGAAAEISEQFLAGLNDQAPSLALPFPVEAIGRGGKWRVTTSPRIAGLGMNVVTELTLTEVTANGAVATLSQTLTFVRGPVEIAETKATVESGELAGKGTVRWDLTKVQPLLDQTIEGSMVLRIGEGDDAQRAEQHQRQTISIVGR
jgi:hypothetical protein